MRDSHPLQAIRRHPLRSVLVATVLTAPIAFGLFYFAPQALFISNTVNEAPPTSASVITHPSASTVPAPTTTDTAPAILAGGSFRSLEHQTTGTAVVLRLSDGTIVLRLENLDTSNGPDVHVTLSPVPSTGGLYDYNNGYLDLGSLKGSKGNQNYVVPDGTDITQFRSAVIWCKRFTVGFAVASITST